MFTLLKYILIKISVITDTFVIARVQNILLHAVINQISYTAFCMYFL